MFWSGSLVNVPERTSQKCSKGNRHSSQHVFCSFQTDLLYIPMKMSYVCIFFIPIFLSWGHKPENKECKEINATLRKNDEMNKKQLQQRKFTYLKFKKTRPITKKTEFEHGSQQIILGENQPMQAYSIREVILTSR